MLAHTECKLESQPSLTSQAFVGIPGTEKRFVLLVSLLALAIPVASQQPDISPFLGTWTLNAAESKLGTLPHPVRFAVTFEVLGSDGMKVSTDQVYEDSRSVGHYDVRFDGYNHPADGFPMSIPPEKTTDERRRAYLPAQGLRPPIALFVTVLWASDRTLVWTSHTYDLDASAESTTFTLITTVSEDGKTMTGIGSDGSVQVFEKQ